MKEVETKGIFRERLFIIATLRLDVSDGVKSVWKDLKDLKEGLLMTAVKVY